MTFFGSKSLDFGGKLWSKFGNPSPNLPFFKLFGT
jgi:transposase